MNNTGIRMGLLIVGGSVLTALLLVTAIGWLFPAGMLEKSSGLIGNLLAIVGTFYGVLLGLIVVDSLTRFERTIDTVRAESNCLADIFLFSERLPDPYASRMKGLCKEYVQLVVSHEWPLMARGHLSMNARKTAVALFRCLGDFEPSTEAEKAVYPAIMEMVREVWDNRRQRAHTAEFGIATIQWIALILGCVVTVILVGMYAVEDKVIQMVAVALATSVIALNLYLVYLFGYPFRGEMSVSERPFQIDIEIFDGVYDMKPAHEAEKLASND
jgi:hypothetical protein